MIHYKRLYIREHEIAEHIKSREDAYVAITSLFIIYLEKVIECYFHRLMHVTYIRSVAFFPVDENPSRIPIQIIPPS